jgi:hypothetical protein
MESSGWCHAASPKLECALRPSAVLRDAVFARQPCRHFQIIWFQAVGFASHPFGCFAFIELFAFQKTSATIKQNSYHLLGQTMLKIRNM